MVITRKFEVNPMYLVVLNSLLLLFDTMHIQYLFFYRQRLIELRNRLVQEPLNVMRLFRLRHRYETVEDKVSFFMHMFDLMLFQVVYNNNHKIFLLQLNLMATIHQTQPTIQLLLSNSDFISALDVIETSLEVLKQELAGVQCFRLVHSLLQACIAQISMMYVILYPQ